jgi:hypothetical protein
MFKLLHAVQMRLKKLAFFEALIMLRHDFEVAKVRGNKVKVNFDFYSV